MALDFTKLTAAVKSVAELAASHANVSALAEDAKAFAKAAEDKVRAEFVELEGKAQSELDGIVAALEAALSSHEPLTHAEAVGVTAVATALSDALLAPVVSPTPPAAPVASPAILYNGLPSVEFAPVPPVAVGVDAKPVPQTVEEYNAMRAAGLLP